MALVVTLAIIAAVSILLVGYVAMMQHDRSAAFHYGASLRAEALAQGGLRLVVQELRREMAKDAAPDTTYPDRPVYTNVSSANLLPQRVGANPAMPALVKTSTSVPAFSGTQGSGTLLASGVRSTEPSQNGRAVSVSRWNRACLGNFPSTNAAPSWIFLTRGGTAPAPAFGPAGATANNAAAGNDGFVLGRMAYAVYDVGGLLDVTAAGYPSGLGADEIDALKRSLAGANLASIGVDQDKLVAWRNQATAASGPAYLHYATHFAATNGFSRVHPGDTTFLSRQDLIDAARAGKAGLTTNAVPHLTVFSRERNAPSWGPTANAGAGFNYAANANANAAANRFLPLVRHAAAAAIVSYRADGSPYSYDVRPGDPVVARRFPLDRLQWLGPAGPRNGGTAANIQACFGLQWDAGTSVWRYVGAGGSSLRSSIQTLAQVAAESREPEFFELLQAGILVGSLGVDGGAAAGGLFPRIHQASVPLQILRIGAAILDQYDEDSCPTIIEYDQSGGTWRACGIESLPYINLYKTLSGVSPDNATDGLAGYYIVGLWNPHQGSPGTARPRVRLRVAGRSAYYNGWGAYTTMVYGYPGFSFSFNSAIELSAAGVNGFSQPGLLTAANVAAVPGNGTPAGLAWAVTPIQPIVGFRLPDFRVNFSKTPPASDPQKKWQVLTIIPTYDENNPFRIVLEFQSPSGSWIPYQYSNGLNDPETWQRGGGGWAARLGTLANPVLPPVADTLTGNSIIYMGNDPRSLRFGLWIFDRNVGQPDAPDAATSPLWSTGAPAPYSASGYGGGLNPGGPAPVQSKEIPPLFGNFYYPARLCRNNTPNSGTTSSYADRDGVRRTGDAGLFTGGAATGNPFQRAADRPVMLNRPFRSVAELGYAFRDDPWRSLDFFTADSADAGLLDLFTVSRETGPVVAGRIHLNSPDAAALAGVIEGALADVLGGTPVGKAASLASRLATHTAAAPLVNKAGLATALGPVLGASEFATEDEQNIKARREACARALSETGQTRTWNLMIDLVAQAGRFPPTAAAPGNFIVEGERRYWLHVAIDRFTGEVLDQMIEPVVD